MNDIKKYLGIDSNISFPMEKLMQIYPKAKDRIIPLSVTGILPRTFFHWKTNGVIDFPIGSSEERINVKLNLFEFVWLRICVSLRDFGLPLSVIKDIKESIFGDMGDLIMQNKEAILQQINSNVLADEETKKFLNAFIPKLEQHYDDFAKENKIFTSVIGSLIASVLLFNKEAAVFIIKKPDGTEFRTLIWGSFAEFEQYSELFIDCPHVMIPMRSIIADFLKNGGNEKYLEKFEFFQPDEKKILEHLQRKDFTEIKIKYIDKKTRIIKIEDEEILGDVVPEIRRLLGLKEYEDITLSFRNKKHLHCRRSTKLDQRPGETSSQ
jgi:hypothetical protein